MRILRIKF